MKNWDDAETRREYLMGMGWSLADVTDMDDERVFALTNPLPGV